MSSKPNIPAKVTGDNLTAIELNEIVDYFSLKVENADELTSGTLPIARIGDGEITEAKLTVGVQNKLNERTTDASDLTSGTLPVARIGDGTLEEVKLSATVASKLNTPYLKPDGSVPLTDNWNAGEFDITANAFIGDGSGLTYPRNLLDINRQEVEPSWNSSGVDPRPPLNVFYSHQNPGYNVSDINEVVEHVDANLTSFDYEGNAMKIKCPNNSNLFFYILTTLNELNDTTVGDYLYFNFEIYSENTITLDIRATTNTGTVVGTSLGSVSITSTVQVINLRVTKSLLSSNNTRFGVRFILSANEFGNNFYVGRLVMSDIFTESIDLVPTIQKYKSPNPVKFLEIGDSKVSQQQSLPKFCLATGNWYSTQEIDFGKNGFNQMGVGGSRIIPTDGNADSIYIRSDDINDYQYDVIGIYGGANDPRPEFASDDSWQYIIGDVNDDPYTGDGTELDFSGYRAYWASVEAAGGTRNPASPYDVSFAACYKGIIKKIFDGNPTAKCYIKTVVIYSGGTTYIDKNWVPMNDMIRQIANYYSIPIVDLFYESGINRINASTFMDAPLVHENSAGGAKIANLMRQRLE